MRPALPLFTMLIFCCLICQKIWGQEYTLKREHLGVHDGLSTKAVTCVIQDTSGDLWLGTDSGLNYYNGFEVKEYNSLNSSLTDDYILALHFLADTQLLIITATEDRPQRFSGMYILNPKSELIEKHEDFVREGVQKKEFVLRQFYKGAFYNLSDQGALWKYGLSEQEWQEVKTPAGFISGAIIDGWVIGSVGKDRYYVSLDNPSLSMSMSELREQDPVSAKVLERGSVLADQLKSTTPLGNAVYHMGLDLVFTTLQQSLYAINAENKLIRFTNGESQIRFSRDAGVVVIDSSGLVFVPTIGGLIMLKINPSKFTTYSLSATVDQALENPGKSVRGLAAFDKMIYAAVDGNIIAQPVNKSGPAKYLPVNSGNRLYPITIEDGKLITGRASIFEFDLRESDFRVLHDSIAVSIDRLWSLYKGGNNLFLGGRKGFAVIDYSALENKNIVSICDSLKNFHSRTIYQFVREDGVGLFYLTSSGLFLSDSKDGDICKPEPVEFTYPNGGATTFSHMTSLYAEGGNSYWLTSTDGGTAHFRFQGGKAVITNTLDRSKGLPTNTAYAAYPDSQGSVWISTDLGLVQLNRTEWSYLFYTEEDGLPMNEFNRISHCADDNGGLFFGGINGLIGFEPGDFYPAPHDDIPLRILSCEQHLSWKDTILDLTDQLRESRKINLHPGDKFCRIQVGLADLFRTDEHQYEYRIPEVNDEWQILSANRLTLNILPYGKHRLYIRGRNAAGIYSRNQLSILIHAKRPFYLQIWFIVLISVGIMLIFRAIWVQKTQRVTLRAEELEAVVQQRTAIISQQAEKLKALEQIRSRFFANISHELRTPLTLIKAPVESLLGREEFRRGEDYLKLIQYNAEILEERINDLLDLAKADAGYLTVQTKPIQVHDFLTRLLDSFEGKASERAVTLKLFNHLPASIRVLADRKKLEHILSNYLSNAVKYGNNGGKVMLEVHQEGEEIVFTVSDEGPGIDPQNLDRVFDRFYTSGSRESGVGLGLALSREYALAMDGQVWVESAPAEGSRFYLRIPFNVYDGIESLPKVPAKSIDAEYHESGVTAANAEGRVILLVEDNRALRNFIRLELKEFNIEPVENGALALQALERLQLEGRLPDLIISDVMMPEMDGFTLLDHIKNDDRWSGVPVIMLTARAGVEDKLRALRIGVHDYLTKPFHVAELRIRIRNLLADRPPVTKAKGKSTQSTSTDHAWLKHLEDAVSNSISDGQYSVMQLAHELHISESQLLRKLKAYTGLTPGKYLREARLQKAREYIESGADFTVASLSAEVGFDDPDYFSRIFAQRFGFRPIEKLRVDPN